MWVTSCMEDVMMQCRTGYLMSWCVSIVGVVAGIEMPAFSSAGMWR